MKDFYLKRKAVEEINNEFEGTGLRVSCLNNFIIEPIEEPSLKVKLNEIEVNDFLEFQERNIKTKDNEIIKAKDTFSEVYQNIFDENNSRINYFYNNELTKLFSEYFPNYLTSTLEAADFTKTQYVHFDISSEKISNLSVASEFAKFLKEKQSGLNKIISEKDPSYDLSNWTLYTISDKYCVSTSQKGVDAKAFSEFIEQDVVLTDGSSYKIADDISYVTQVPYDYKNREVLFSQKKINNVDTKLNDMGFVLTDSRRYQGLMTEKVCIPEFIANHAQTAREFMKFIENYKN